MSKDSFIGLGCPRGTVWTHGSSSGRYIQLAGLNIPNVLLVGVTGGDADIVTPVPTLEFRTVFYLFGVAPSVVQIQGLCLLDGVGTGKDGVAGAVKGFFEANRVSKSKKSVTLTFGGAGYKVFIHEIQWGQMDTEKNTHAFVIAATVAGLPGGKTGGDLLAGGNTIGSIGGIGSVL
jgi:hypothetical protein